MWRRPDDRPPGACGSAAPVLVPAVLSWRADGVPSWTVARCDPAVRRRAETAVSTPDPGDVQPPRDPPAAFAELSKIMLSEQPLSATLERVAELAKQTIPGAADVSVTLMDDGQVSSVAFTGPLSAQLD